MPVDYALQPMDFAERGLREARIDIIFHPMNDRRQPKDYPHDDANGTDNDLNKPFHDDSKYNPISRCGCI